MGYICFIFYQSIRTVYHVLTSESVSVVCVRAGETQELFVQKKTNEKRATNPFS